MDDRTLEQALAGLSAWEPSPDRMGPEFHDCIWERVGELHGVRERRRHALLGLGIFAIALGTGMGATQAPLAAESSGYGLFDGADLAPSALLRVSR